MAQTLRDQPPEATERQGKHRHETTNGRIERRLPDASPWSYSHLVCVCPAFVTVKREEGHLDAYRPQEFQRRQPSVGDRALVSCLSVEFRVLPVVTRNSESRVTECVACFAERL